MIRWFARNDIAANLLMAAILIAGVWSAFKRVPLEVQPSIRFNQVRITVEYRGGSPDDVERGVIIPVERVLKDLPGVDYIESTAQSGFGTVLVHVDDYTDPKELLEEARSRIATVTSFPAETEPPKLEVPDSGKWFDVIKIAVAGDMDERDLLVAARKIQDDLTALPGISQASIQGQSPFEIAIEADPARLRDFGLTFADLAEAVRRNSLDLPAGQIQTDEGSLVIRSKGQAYTQRQFGELVVRNSLGAEVLLHEVARISDGFEENRKILRFNGIPALLVEVLRLNNENALEIAKSVKDYVATQRSRFPEGVSLHVWDDSSVELEGRLGTLMRNLLQGALLVFIVLGLFLRPSIAFWVVLGIPVSFAGALLVMPSFDLTANVMSIFGFIIVVGMVVDDAIVTAENVYTKLRQHGDPLEAVVDGTKEVAIPVTFGVLTTIVAFVPLMFFQGFYGNFTRQVPPVITAVLLFSLIESKLILPSHLKHIHTGRTNLGRFAAFQKRVADALERFVENTYRPLLTRATHHRYLTLALFTALALACLGIIQSGRLGFVNMPAIDRNKIIAQVTMPRDTPLAVTDERVHRITAAIGKLRDEFRDPGTGQSLVLDHVSSTGGWSGWGGTDARQGFVSLNILDPGLRSTPGPRNSVIAKRWTELVGTLPDAQSFWISGDRGGGFRGGGDDLESLEIEIRGPASPEKDAITEQVEELLASYKGIASTWSSLARSRDELHVTIRPEGRALGLTQRELARQVRAAFFGEEAQRVQRGQDDIRVMVRLPLSQRQSLHTLEQLRVRTPDGGQAPFRTVADATFAKARSEIQRIDGAQIVSIFAKPADETVDVVAISRDLSARIDEYFRGHAELSWRYQGYVAEHEDTRARTWFGAAGLFLALYIMLSIPFRSLVQPLYVMTAIPFGLIGAMLGHLLLDITPSYLSVFGMLALAGVVVNDSIVMLDFINQKRQAGMDRFQAVIQSGTRRFRPILLTSLTTFAGLAPMMSAKSLQAQFLVPMAVSLAFGILFATFITLFLIPSCYLVGEDLRDHFRRGWHWYRKPFGNTDPAPAAVPTPGQSAE